jgi:hypothetical protein
MTFDMRFDAKKSQILVQLWFLPSGTCIHLDNLEALRLITPISSPKRSLALTVLSYITLSLQINAQSHLT